MKAYEAIRQAMIAALPDDANLPWGTVNIASWTGSGRNRKAVADVVMFDGALGVITAWETRLGWGLAWITTGGDDIELRDGAWRRVSRESLAVDSMSPTPPSHP